MVKGKTNAARLLDSRLRGNDEIAISLTDYSNPLIILSIQFIIFVIS
jgi:hypothetical protein